MGFDVDLALLQVHRPAVDLQHSLPTPLRSAPSRSVCPQIYLISISYLSLFISLPPSLPLSPPSRRPTLSPRLQVDDPAFWAAIPALPLPTGLPGIMTEVVAVGFAMGGDELSTTRGVVNRITLGGATRELILQIDATVSPGNSGGPVLGPTGALLGLSASLSSCSRPSESQPQHAGYIIPMPVIHAFLRNVANAARAGLPYQGRATDSFRLQPLENLALRSQLGLPPRPGPGEDGGVPLQPPHTWGCGLQHMWLRPPAHGAAAATHTGLQPPHTCGCGRQHMDMALQACWYRSCRRRLLLRGCCGRAT